MTLCRSRQDGNKVRKKIESSSSLVVKLKSLELEWKEEMFSKATGKGDKWNILLCVGGENRAPDPNFGEKTTSWFRPFETALSSIDFYKLRKPPQNFPKTMKQAKWTTEIRQCEYIFFIVFPKGNILFHHAILYIVILNSIQCLVERRNSQRPKV